MLNAITPVLAATVRFAGPPAAQGARYAIMAFSGTVVTCGAITAVGIAGVGIALSRRGVGKACGWTLAHLPTWRAPKASPPYAVEILRA